MNVEDSRRLVWAVIVESSTSPTVMIAVPTIGNSR
jgi:hypothetical protein